MKNLTGCVTILTVAVTVFVSATVYAGPADYLPKNATVVATKTKTVKGQTFQFIKFMNPDGVTDSVILNPAGKPIPESALPVAERSVIGKGLLSILNRKPSDQNYVKDDKVIDVLIGLKQEDGVYHDPPEYGSAIIDENGVATVTINGKDVTEQDVELNLKKRTERITAHREARIKKRRNILQKLADRNGLHHIPGFQKAVDNGRNSVKLAMAKGQITAFVRKNKELIAGVELYNKPRDMLDDAMISTKINPWALDWPDNRRKNPG